MAQFGKMLGRVRGLFTGNYPENREDEQFHVDNMGNNIVTQALPPLTEIVRLGDSWQVMGVAYAALTGVGSTAGRLTIWNGEPSNGKIYIIDSIAYTKIIIDTTQLEGGFSCLVQIIKQMTIPTDAAYVPAGLSGKRYGGRMRTVATSTTLAANWDMVGSSGNPAAVIAGSAWQQVDINLFGKYILRPGDAFAINISEVTNTASKFRTTIRWHEVQIPYVF